MRRKCQESLRDTLLDTWKEAEDWTNTDMSIFKESSDRDRYWIIDPEDGSCLILFETIND